MGFVIGKDLWSLIDGIDPKLTDPAIKQWTLNDAKIICWMLYLLKPHWPLLFIHTTFLMKCEPI